MNDLESFKNIAQKEKKFVIYGAQHHAHCMCIALKIIVPEISLLFFMVSDKKNNPDSMEGIAVRDINECAQEDRNIPILVAASEKYYDEIYETLRIKKFVNIINGTFGGRFDNDVRELYFKKCFPAGNLEFKMLRQAADNADLRSGQTGWKETDIGMYMAKSIVDRKLQKETEIPEYMHVVQAGAALAEKQIASYRDDVGENISHKNRNYCECTVTYYIWKNAAEDYVGLCHYRRRFVWDDSDLEALRRERVDVVLPCPVITVKGQYDIHYKPYVEEQVFNTMISVLEEHFPEYYAAALEVMQGDLFYPCNILMAKKKVFDAYARWLFGVLERVEDICGDETVRNDRYLGYLAEHLTTFYFVRNRNDLNIVHSRMEILK